MYRMKNVVEILLCLLVSAFFNKSMAQDYAVVARQKLKTDTDWAKVISFLQEKHHAPVFYYNNSPSEILDSLKFYTPRYVAFVEEPKQVDRELVMLLHRMSRQVDDDVYSDYIWGIITGYDAKAALKLANNGVRPLTIKSAVSTIAELREAKWFDRFAWIDDHQDGLCGEKRSIKDSVITYTISPDESLQKFYDFYKEYDPDFIVTSGHATERNLEMPFSHGNIKSKNGFLYAAFPEGKEYLVESGKRRVFLGAGNCLLGNVRKNPNSMAIACLGSGNAAAMVGYVVTSWYGRAGWGTLKYWLFNPGRYTLAEAVFLNEQDMLFQMNRWNSNFNQLNFPYSQSDAQFRGEMKKAVAAIQNQLGIENPTKDQVGFLYDRDVLAYYGDPKADIRLQEMPEEEYKVDFKVKGEKCIIKIKTRKNFNMNHLKGEQFKQEHVGNLPFSYFFPERLKSPRLVSKCSGDILINKDFMLIYEPNFKPGETYKIVLEMGL